MHGAGGVDEDDVRGRHLVDLQRTVDDLARERGVGGRVVGAGTALDAVTRGLSTGIVEARDWASG
ncbi:hypothetical protein, partial [Streptomyces sp. NPDC049887]|uniref:hypothetical protein n=1 Tax=Streptomyces sp. NPDC049887 TaxID=3155654 RepID=UPI003431FDF4